MAKEDIVIVFDCGATNVRVIAINSKGIILASASFPNNTQPDPFNPAYRIWDVYEIWDKMCRASQKVISQINSEMIIGATVTTFGVDGAMFDITGKMLFPVISWQCERTHKILEDIAKYIPVSDLYHESGVFPFSFNTINKLLWLNENKPELVNKCHRFLFMPSIFTYFLTGEMANDTTMCGTSMLTSLSTRDFSSKIMNAIDFSVEKLGKPLEPGTIAGKVHTKSSKETLLPAGTPVVLTGHDTQFAIFGSGAVKNQPVLSSGTWEILMVRSDGFRSGNEQLNAGITTELDSRPGLFDIGNQWVASGILEWAQRNLYADLKENAYEILISGAEKVPPDCNGISVVPDFYKGIAGGKSGQILGLTLESTREEIYRAILEALSKRLAEGKRVIEDAGGFKTESILCVGGGSKNRLWNQLRANATGVPLKIIDQKETTVLGASLFVQAACGNAESPEDARSAINYNVNIIEPKCW